LYIANRKSPRLKQRKSEVKLLDNRVVKAGYQIEISNRFDILADLSNNEDYISNIAMKLM